MAQYLAELRRLTEYCEFGGYLNKALRDRLVCGLKSKSIQKKLLTEVELGCLTWLMEWKLPVNLRVSSKNQLKWRRQFMRKDRTSSPDRCYYRDKICQSCHKRGKVCKTNKESPQQLGGSSHSAAHVEQENTSEDEQESDMSTSSLFTHTYCEKASKR